MVNLLSIRPGGGLSAKRSPRLAVGTRRKCFQHTRNSKIPGNALQSKGPKAMTRNVAICIQPRKGLWFVVAALEKENEALRLKVQELERKAMRQEVKVQERQSSTKKQRL